MKKLYLRFLKWRQRTLLKKLNTVNEQIDALVFGEYLQDFTNVVNYESKLTPEERMKFEKKVMTVSTDKIVEQFFK